MLGKLTFIQGKSGSGKTRLIMSTYSKADSIFLSSQTVMEYLLNQKCIEQITAGNIIIEDIDFLKGRIATQQQLCRLVDGLLADSHNVIISGINLPRRVPIIFSMRDSETATVITM